MIVSLCLVKDDNSEFCVHQLTEWIESVFDLIRYDNKLCSQHITGTSTEATEDRLHYQLHTIIVSRLSSGQAKLDSQPQRDGIWKLKYQKLDKIGLMWQLRILSSLSTYDLNLANVWPLLDGIESYSTMHYVTPIRWICDRSKFQLGSKDILYRVRLACNGIEPLKMMQKAPQILMTLRNSCVMLSRLHVSWNLLAIF